MEKCYTVAETVKLTGVKSYVLVTGRMNFPFLFAEMSWGIAATPRMIFNCF